jgi:UDP-glucose 4-epimerase
MKVLVTGGAGYIGSHVTRQLRERGIEVVVYDNLSSGHAWAVLDAQLVEGDLADRQRLGQLLQAHRFDAVLHFAAHIVVPESVQNPLKYYANNTVNTFGLLEACNRHGVRHFVFSSTAAVYGIPAQMPITETAALAPINPYGASKMMSERMLFDLGAASDLRYVSLRYFNVAGADPLGRLGQASADATHLIKVAAQVATGQRQSMEIFGDDYPTPDGTCIRDYIHVEDLALAHLDALDYLFAGGSSEVFNCGYGHGYSVREVIDTMSRQLGTAMPASVGPRRAGDPPALVADSRKIRRILGWQPRHDDLGAIVRDALQWERIWLQRSGGDPQPARGRGSAP